VPSIVRLKTIAVAVVVVVMASAFPSVAPAATMDEYLTCSLVYGALFEAAKRTQHEGMLQYARPRLQVVLPYMQENKENPSAKRRLREIAIAHENEIRYEFVQRVSVAITERDPVKLRASIARVFECDKAFGLATLPLPIPGKAAVVPNKYLEGFQEGCLAKQRSTQRPLPDAKIRRYCSCMTESASERGVDGTTTETQLGQVIRETHGTCLTAIQ
jgi:hypothetical protein